MEDRAFFPVTARAMGHGFFYAFPKAGTRNPGRQLLHDKSKNYQEFFLNTGLDGLHMDPGMGGYHPWGRIGPDLFSEHASRYFIFERDKVLGSP